MSITWEEPGAGGALKKTATQIAALVLLAIVGGIGGAFIASSVLQGEARPPAAADGPAAAEPAGDAAIATGGTAQEPRDARQIAPQANQQAEPQVEPQVTRQVPPGVVPAADTGQPAEPAPAAETFDPPQLAALALPAAAPSAPEAPASALPPAEIDMGETASLVAAAEPVAVAETEAEVAALEARMAAEGADAFAVQAEEPAPVGEVAAAVPAASPETPLAPNGTPLTPARAAKYVNLRAGPDNDAEVIAIVPARDDLLAEENCVHWCAVLHDGREGFIYKTFIWRES